MLVALGGLGLEIGARYGVPLVNQNMRRFRDEFARASAVRANAAKPSTSLLLLGNSLTFTDIDLNRLQEELGPECEVMRWAIDDTSYLDWYFGLRQLFQAGGRPRFVVLGATANHLVSVKFRGTFFAHYILHRRDLFAAARRTGADASGVSKMMLAKASTLYGCRDEVYKRVMISILPGFEGFARSLTRRVDSTEATSEEVAGRAVERLSELRDLCQQHGAQLVLWHPPLKQLDLHEAAVLTAAGRTGVPLIVPVAGGEFANELFRDPIHLKPAGARLFTPRLAAQLRPLVLGSGNVPDGSR